MDEQIFLGIPKTKMGSENLVAKLNVLVARGRLIEILLTLSQ